MAQMHRWLSGISALFGAWVFVSVFALGASGSHYWNDLVVGAAIFILAGYSFLQEASEPSVVWTSALAALLGLWMIATPFVYSGVSSTMMWSGVISGVVVAILSGYDAYDANRSGRTAAAERSGA
ncbi:MAG: SPW repeat protein [Haloarculaceae archaeon]